MICEGKNNENMGKIGEEDSGVSYSPVNGFMVNSDEFHKILSLARLNPHELVLILEQGKIGVSNLLIESGYTVIRCKMGEMGIVFTQPDRRETGFPDNFFESVVSYNLLSTSPDPAFILEELKRVSKGFGKILIMEERAKKHNESSVAESVLWDKIDIYLKEMFGSVEIHFLEGFVLAVAGRKQDRERICMTSHNRCFACGRENPAGLDIKFLSADKDMVFAQYTVKEEYAGYPGMAQGGIIATLLDSAMANCVFHHSGVQGVTARLNVRFLKPLNTNLSLYIEARMKKVNLGMYEVESSIRQDNILRAQGEGIFFAYP